jgi:hypothetical protein
MILVCLLAFSPGVVMHTSLQAGSTRFCVHAGEIESVHNLGPFGCCVRIVVAP